MIVDDTNLRPATVRAWARLAARSGPFEVHDFTEVPLEECLRRDAGRPDGERVGERTSAGCRRYLAGTCRSRCRFDPDEPGVLYDPDPGLPEAILVDIDGTVALIADRSPYDWSRVGDAPNHAVITAVRAMHAAGNTIVFCSGRDDCRAETEAWLELSSACRTRGCSCGRRRHPQGLDREAGGLRAGDPAPWRSPVFSTTGIRWYACGERSD